MIFTPLYPKIRKNINAKAKVAAAALIEQKNGARGEIPNYVGCALVLLERLLVKVKEERERRRIFCGGG